MNKAVQQTLGWTQIVTAILIGLNQGYKWPGYLQYIWASIVVITGIWTLVAK